jgi:tetratricopeptide (TPR) repeat protein
MMKKSNSTMKRKTQACVLHASLLHATFGLVAVASSLMVTSHRAYAQVEDDLREGDKYFEEGGWKKAAAAYDRAIRKYPGQVSAEAYGKRAAIFIISKDYKGGLAFVDSSRAQFPNAPEIGEQEALMLWALDKKPQAITVAEKVVAQKPKSFTNQNLIGEFYSTKDPTKTVTAYEAYLNARPEELEASDVLPRIRLGFALLATARTNNDDAKASATFTKAAEQFDIVQKKHGKRPHAQVNADSGLCAAYTGLGKYDQAITICERIISDAKRIDATGAVWYNLGEAYLAKKQVRKARSAASEFTRVRRNESRGFMLVGDTFFADKDWSNALDQYQRAEKLLRAGQTRDAVQLSIRLGKTYRRLPGADNPSSPNLQLAIDKLSAGLAANPDSPELTSELGGAYLAARQDAKATALTDRIIASNGFGKFSPEGRAALLVLSGKALFNQNKVKESRARFEAAYQLRGTDIQIRRNLVDTINAQAYVALGKDPKAAQALVDEALKIDADSAPAITNLAVLSLDRGDCAIAQKHLTRLKELATGDSLVQLRLLARSYLCIAKPDNKKAAELYAAAEKEAKNVNANITLAEIYTEWAPLLWDTDLNDAVEKLQFAVTASAQAPEVATAAKRNLAIALFRRGWRSMRDGKNADASADFERAVRDPALLKGTEPLAFEFSLAIANLDRGATAEASKIFKSLAAKGNQAAYLKAPYSTVGSQFFSAYANYRSGNVVLRQQAAGEFTKLQSQASGGFTARLKELIASSWELVAFDQFRSGKAGLASKSLAAAAQNADGDMKRRVAVNRAALSLNASELGTLEAMQGTPVEALINLGILYDQLGRPKDAYDVWVKAKARGSQHPNLQKWIDSKKRIYGL